MTTTRILAGSHTAGIIAGRTVAAVGRLTCNAARLIAETSRQVYADDRDVQTVYGSGEGWVEANGATVLRLPLNTDEARTLRAFLDDDGFADEGDDE